MSYPHDTHWKWLPQEVIIFTKFHKVWTKNANILRVDNFWIWALFWLRLYDPFVILHNVPQKKIFFMWNYSWEKNDFYFERFEKKNQIFLVCSISHRLGSKSLNGLSRVEKMDRILKFLLFWYGLDLNNGKILWTIWIFQFERKVHFWDTLIFISVW